MSGSSKQGVRPAQMYSHTLPSHHPGRHPPNSGSSHPDTRGRGRTATPRHPAPTQPLRRCAKPTPVVDSRLLLFIIPLASHHPARWRSRDLPQTRGGTPGVVWRPRVRRYFLLCITVFLQPTRPRPSFRSLQKAAVNSIATTHRDAARAPRTNIVRRTIHHPTK